MNRTDLIQTRWRFFRLLTLPGFLVLLQPQLSPGQSKSEPLVSNTIGLGPQVGYWQCHDVHEGTTYVGVLSRIRIGTIMAIEGAVGYTGEQKFNLSQETGEDVTASVHSVPATASLVLYAPIAPTFLPYVVGGVGAHYVILDYSNYLNDNFLADKKKIRFGYHVGFGLELPLNEHLALHGDYRYLFLDNAFEKELQFDFSGTSYRANSFSAGFAVYF
jgi:opacity protein-like surface antigen